MADKESNQSNPDSDEALRTIGEGNNSKISLAKHEGKTLARKELKHGSLSKEIEILEKLKHRNVVEFDDSSIDEKGKVLYMKYYEKGDLDNLIEEKKKKGEDFSIDVYGYKEYYLFDRR